VRGFSLNVHDMPVVEGDAADRRGTVFRFCSDCGGQVTLWAKGVSGIYSWRFWLVFDLLPRGGLTRAARVDLTASRRRIDGYAVEAGCGLATFLDQDRRLIALPKPRL